MRAKPVTIDSPHSGLNGENAAAVDEAGDDLGGVERECGRRPLTMP